MDRIRFLFAAKKDYSELAVFCKNKEARKPLKKILASKGVARVAVAKSGNGEIVGKALLYVLPWTARKNSSRAIIAEVFVREGYRNKGIATRLVKFCIKPLQIFVGVFSERGEIACGQDPSVYWD